MRLNNRLGLMGLCSGKVLGDELNMADEAEGVDVPPKKGAKLPLIIGLVLAMVGGGGGFFAVQSGMLFGESGEEDEQMAEEINAAQSFTASFVPIDPLIISLPGTGGRDHLRFSAQLEVVPEFVAEIEAIKPRIVDVLNEYLRAVDLEELEDPTVLV